MTEDNRTEHSDEQPESDKEDQSAEEAPSIGQDANGVNGVPSEESETIPIETEGADEEDDQEIIDPIVQVEILERKLKVTHDRLLRTAADLDNLRRRSKREISEAIPIGRKEVLTEILPVMDSIDLALASADPNASAAAIIEGMQMVRRQFLATTEKFGLQEIESLGVAFDPNYHEAVGQLASDTCPAGVVIEELRKGYMLEDKLLRPSMVMVSKGTDEDPSNETGEDKMSEKPEKDTNE